MTLVVKGLFSSRANSAMKKLKNRRGKIDWEERDEQNFCQVFSSLVGLCKADISNRGVYKEFRRFFSWEVCMLFATDVPLHRFHGIRFKVKRRLVVGRQSIFFVPVRSTAMKHNQQKLKALWN